MYSDTGGVHLKLAVNGGIVGGVEANTRDVLQGDKLQDRGEDPGAVVASTISSEKAECDVRR